jgi:hypothetical protein
MTDESEIRSIPEDRLTEENPIQYPVPAIQPQNPASGKTIKIDRAGGVPQVGLAVATPVQIPRNRHQYQPLAPSGPMAPSYGLPMPIVQERAKRGPKPYAPPQAIPEACQERLATSLRELIPYLNRNLRPARPPAPGGKYAKHARPNVKIPDLVPPVRQYLRFAYRSLQSTNGSPEYELGVRFMPSH